MKIATCYNEKDGHKADLKLASGDLHGNRGVAVAVCARCERTLPIIDFPYLVKGKQPFDSPRQKVCRPCRAVQHSRAYGRQQRAEYFDARCMDYKRQDRRDQQVFRWKPTEPQRREIELMEELMDVRGMTDPLWLDLCSEVAV